MKKIPTKYNFSNYEIIDYKIKQRNLQMEIIQGNSKLSKTPVLCVLSQKNPTIKFVYHDHYGEIPILNS